ncbi:metallophosphoesterase family protein [Sorangium atrum]|uniref:Metallophosphoesterase family protein n=1 Tax=Sorangium atrum TaxID=2995308 RepID=A0ABT5C3D7_9BACT|nr:metallophosphoesterase family protein [Sorangium aterium]MDC0680279.1 metallophosphoesterase family protein [Sorangium aterium]
MPAEPTERVVAISDIHMGADNGRSIFSAQQELAAFIDYLAAAPERLDLIVLGDALDYLQVSPFLDFTGATARQKTQAIVAHNREVFDAFGRFIGSGKRLRWCMGNHDIELALPEAQAELVDAVTRGVDPGAHARLELCLRSERLDYPLARGGLLRLVHGNKGDPWNEVDHDALAEAVRTGAPFPYPPGSRLVAEVLNPLKDDGFAHVDLLKPEQTVALPLTLALWPDNTKKHLAAAFPAFFATKAVGIKSRLQRAFIGTRPRFGTSPPAGAVATATTPEDLLASALSDSFAGQSNDARDQTLNALSSLLGDAKGTEAFTRAVTTPQAPGKTFSGSLPERFIESALRACADNANRRSNLWSLEAPDELDPYVSGAFEDGAVVVVAGHTHLARAVSYPGGYYLNTGTWANLMRIPAYVRGAEFAAHARSLKEFLKHPELAPAELRPFQRLTYADVDLRPAAGGPAFRAELREWTPGPSRAVSRFP